jgi:hypothetical protein
MLSLMEAAVVNVCFGSGVHQYLAESNPRTRREWIAALDTIEENEYACNESGQV